MPSLTAPVDHKKKVQEYNEMLEDIYQREVELTKIKSHLLAMRDEIVEEAQIYGGAEAMQSVIAASTILNMGSYDDDSFDGESTSGSDNVMSDGAASAGSTSIAPYKAAAKASKPKPKIKGTMKSKGTGYRRSNVPEGQLGASWDYRLDVGRGGRHSLDEERPEL